MYFWDWIAPISDKSGGMLEIRVCRGRKPPQKWYLRESRGRGLFNAGLNVQIRPQVSKLRYFEVGVPGYTGDFGIHLVTKSARCAYGFQVLFHTELLSL